MENKFDFNDILIKPSNISDISSRKEVNPYYDGFLPIITAPMDTVIDPDNEEIFHNLKINTCLPRYEISKYGWNSFSLDQMILMFNYDSLDENKKYLIDIANGHMSELVSTVRRIKEKMPNITLMVGNIANPMTYVTLSEAGADYIRVGIGGGAGCTTTVHTAIGYPMASLIRECYHLSLNINNPAKIVADGGMQTYSDIIKALALGADYAMVGSIFNKAIESCGENYLLGKIKVSQTIANWAYNNKIPVYKKFRGMSTKEVQKKWGKEVLTTSEGVIRFRKVEYPLAKWAENFEAYLRSSMSYTNSRTLSDFIGNVDIIKITDNAYKRYNK